MSRRRRRRHADPATLPRRDPAQPSERDRRDERDRTSRELARIDDALARAVAVMGAALVYFGVWALNEALGLFPPPQGLDLTHPQFLVGVGALLASLWAARWLARRYETRRLVAIGTWASVAFGAFVVLFTTAFAATGSSGVAFGLISAGMGISWLVATLWVGFLGRRARSLLAASSGRPG